jgi:hypothetical protein
MALATVSLPEYNRTFNSAPAAFGKGIPAVAISAYLQVINDWPRLCKDEGRVPNPDDVVTPDDGRPVALLVERGTCTFWEKGDTASFWSPIVEYVIVYDMEYKQELVPMSSDLDSDMGLLFVTRETGLRK